MTEKNCEANPFDYFIDSFWASLPEKTADDIATFKKDVLRAIRDGVDRVIDDAIKSTERHVENARRMRQQYRQSEGGETPPTAA